MCQMYETEGFCTHGENCSYYHQNRDRYQNYSEKDSIKSDEMQEGVKYLEETVATLTISLYTLQGQLFDLKQEVEQNTEPNDTSV